MVSKEHSYTRKHGYREKHRNEVNTKLISCQLLFKHENSVGSTIWKSKNYRIHYFFLEQQF